MNDFKASNGIVLEAGGTRGITLRHPGGSVFTLDQRKVDALREFFRAERDEQLGRWRWPKNPDYVVYPRGKSAAHVLDESSGVGSMGLIFRDANRALSLVKYRAAYAYFDAHPEPKKPWHDAKPGEMWALTVDGEEQVPGVVSSSESGYPVLTVATVDAGGTEEILPRSDRITAGRRIWPEVAE